MWYSPSSARFLFSFQQDIFATMSNRASTYYTKGNHVMSPALLRARKPYFWRNMAGLVVLGGISASVYIYTYTFLTKDDFEDIPIPPISDEKLAVLKKEYEASKQKK
ncbi:unnamed protein product [Kuraishia capsulata CBS 1993]|uniref:Cytochrome c oxidase assembly factor 3 n=1 Tax=Kuraishia capsulata CBS 1993 TaxID=1382522 RepID=W6MKW6_9ASCO|nr:uncharacterized protein KUCA_T00003018001 [Kuraishia capsulata CBS 1993]CDK27041.1 unnamed protein product [Kuraishia capsulata CBS 1993]